MAAALVILLSSTAAARAQTKEAPAPVPAEQEAEAAEQDDLPALDARPHIQVLQHPYDISSFYRSGQGSEQSDFGYEPEQAGDRYPIASFYRSGGGASGRYSQFWTSGYGNYGGYRNNTRQRGRGQGLIGAARPRALGLNGDLMLFAPTFLAPVGPLTGVFFER
jgi:hypothetical protein